MRYLYLKIERYYGGNPKLRKGATYGAEILDADPYPTAQDMGWVSNVDKGFIIWKKIGILKQSFGLCSLPQQQWLEGRLPAGRVTARCSCCISRSALSSLHYVQFTTAPASCYRVHYG